MLRTSLLLLVLAGCGSTPTKPSSPEPSAPPAKQSTKPANIVAKPTPPKPTPPKEAPPIDIPAGRLHDGYVLGGLPSKRQFDLAVEAGFDEAMSLMSSDEEGISEVAPYATSIGVRYIRFTIRDERDLNEAMAWQFAATLAMLGKPAIIHSAKGERVGAIFALMAFFVEEVSAEEALAIGAATGMGNLEGHVRSQLTSK